MNVNPLAASIAGAAAGQQQAQAAAETSRAQQGTSQQERRVETDLRAELAAGIGQTDGEDHAAGERDADGRRVWEQPPPRQADEEQAAPLAQSGRHASGAKGRMLDLTA